MTAKVASKVEIAMFMLMAHLQISPKRAAMDADLVMMFMADPDEPSARKEFFDLIDEVLGAMMRDEENPDKEHVKRALGLLTGTLINILRKFRETALEGLGIDSDKFGDNEVDLAATELRKLMMHSIMDGMSDEKVRDQMLKEITEDLDNDGGLEELLQIVERHEDKKRGGPTVSTTDFSQMPGNDDEAYAWVIDMLENDGVPVDKIDPKEIWKIVQARDEDHIIGISIQEHKKTGVVRVVVESIDCEDIHIHDEDEDEDEDIESI